MHRWRHYKSLSQTAFPANHPTENEQHTYDNQNTAMEQEASLVVSESSFLMTHQHIISYSMLCYGWLCGTAVDRRSLAGELSLYCARPVADGWPLMWVNHPLYVNEPGKLSLSSLRVDKWVVKLQLDVCCLSCGGTIWWTLMKERQAWCCLQVKLCDPCLSALREYACVLKWHYINTLPFLSFFLYSLSWKRE